MGRIAMAVFLALAFVATASAKECDATEMDGITKINCPLGDEIYLCRSWLSI